ncbi:hypothetical protein POM88_049386 [Heracleum sosnowskyi]|uniref:Uncharacterized protein n=1 Tax=Heracleum sosnowskyi TaxID=360622 RepID=A0AAD8LZG5_9APIA|nr:hypothetical protein POM88_049386 [Heracleum sosnowskyi]
MLPGLGSTKILNLDLKTIKALSSICDCLVNFPSPFYNLKYVKLAKGCEVESISSTLRSYLLAGSPSATFLTTLQQKNMIPHTEVAPVTAENVMLQVPLAAPTKILVHSEKKCTTMCIDTVDMGVQDEHVVQNSVGDVHWVRQIDAPIERTGNDQVRMANHNA